MDIKFLIRDSVASIMMRLFSLLPMDENKIIFTSFRGDSFSDNPRAIYDAMIKIAPDLNYIWTASASNHRAIPGAKKVKHGSVQEMYHLATSKVWIDNKRKGIWTRKRKNQYYFMTWHGGGVSLKKLEKDAINSLPDHYVVSAIHDSKVADYFLSGAKWNTQNYRDAFWYSGKILELGMPRSSKLYKSSKGPSAKVRKHYQLKENTKIALYAPTFRNENSLEQYDIDFENFLKALRLKFGGDWVIILRLHPNIAEEAQGMHQKEAVLNGNTYNDITELIIASDIFITDYSGLMFDALESNKICLLYTRDIEEYSKERDTYFKLEELPFPIARNNEELIQTVMDFDDGQYKGECNRLKERLGLFNNKDSDNQVAEFVISLMQKDKNEAKR